MDAGNTTGNRNSSPSFPELGSTPDTTYWYSNPTEVPGAHKGANASGDETTYDRMRVSSAASVVYFPIYNYATSLGNKKPILGTFMGLEKDGMFHGADGCYGFDGEIPHAVSSQANRAAEIAPHLCPEGKYGYDPRCRDWFVDETMLPCFVFRKTANFVSPISGMPLASACIWKARCLFMSRHRMPSRRLQSQLQAVLRLQLPIPRVVNTYVSCSDECKH